MGYDPGDSFPFDLNQMEIHLVQNRKENCHYDHIPFNEKGNGNIVFSVCSPHDAALKCCLIAYNVRVHALKFSMLIRILIQSIKILFQKKIS